MMSIRNMRAILFALILIFIQLEVSTSTAGISTYKFRAPKKFQSNNHSVFTFLDNLEANYDNPVSLGDGYPDFKPPVKLSNAVIKSLVGNWTMSQYVQEFGIPRLLNIIAKFYTKFLNIQLDPNDNVLVTEGSTEALFVSIYGNTFPGDEWIIFDPYFEVYAMGVRSAQGIPRFVPLRLIEGKNGSSASDYTFDRDELTQVFNKKTKGIVVNSPHNPFGKIFTYDELEFIANLAKKWDTLVVYDEVYQFLIYKEDMPHIRMATLPDMFERTITVGTISKLFSATGYRVGWAYGPTQLMDNLRIIHPLLINCVPGFIQEGVAIALEDEYRIYGQPQSYIVSLRKRAKASRDFLVDLFRSVDFAPIVPDAGYFISADWTKTIDISKYNATPGDSKDYTFVKLLMAQAKVTSIPLSGFYSPENKHMGENGIRITLLKSDETLLRARKALLAWKSQNAQ